jgi:hypothetical protein
LKNFLIQSILTNSSQSRDHSNYSSFCKIFRILFRECAKKNFFLTAKFPIISSKIPQPLIPKKIPPFLSKIRASPKNNYSYSTSPDKKQLIKVTPNRPHNVKYLWFTFLFHWFPLEISNRRNIILDMSFSFFGFNFRFNISVFRSRSFWGKTSHHFSEEILYSLIFLYSLTFLALI